MKNYNINWEKTRENINFRLRNKTYKKNLSLALNVSERTAQIKMKESSGELPVSDLLLLADYLECDIMDLLILEGEIYKGPISNEKEKYHKTEVEDESSEDVIEALDIIQRKKASYKIRNLSEFLLYLPLIKEDRLRDVVFRCYGRWSYDYRDYVMSQMSYLYESIPDCEAKRDADACRDNLLRVKGAPGNNMYGLHDKNFNRAYRKNLDRYVKEGNSNILI